MSDPQLELLRSLDEQRAEYARRRGLAMPLAGSIVWTLIGIAGAFLPPILAVWVAVHRDRLHRLSQYDALALHRRELPRQEQAEERLRQPLLPLRRDGTARLCDRHSFFPRRLHVIKKE